LSDLNAELIDVYSAVKGHPEELAKKLRTFPTSSDFYYSLRRSSPRTLIGRAARFLYLNRTAFGGIFRVNQRGEFNVPYGGGERDHRVLYESDLLHRASAALQHVELVSADFAKVMGRLRSGDVAYCDPTYSVAHENNGFVRYNERNFSWRDQERLAAAAKSAQSRGATVIVSNAYHESVRELFASSSRVVLHRNSMVSADVAMRRPVKEYLFVYEALTY
jgi:DNA adenine methylase